MKRLENWDNKTWLSSKKYISTFNNFLKSKIKLKKNTTILDMGCGRANINSSLQEKYRFKNKPIGIDIIRSKNIKKNIIFNKVDALSFLKKTNKKFDLILIKQTIHFFSKEQIKYLLSQVKSKLNIRGKLLIFSLKTENNRIPCFAKMKIKLNKSLKKDELLLLLEKNNTPDVAQPEPEKQSINVQATKGNQTPMEKTDASQPSAKMLIIGAIVLLAIIYFVFK